jgi:hypothetical protein
LLAPQWRIGEIRHNTIQHKRDHGKPYTFTLEIAEGIENEGIPTQEDEFYAAEMMVASFSTMSNFECTVKFVHGEIKKERQQNK